jgi:hypothetical protein
MHITEQDLILHYYDERGADPRVETHLAECLECRRAFAELRDVLAMVDSQPMPEPRPGFERDVWARLEPQLSARRAGWFERWFSAPPRWALAGAIAAIVLAAFVAGRFSTGSTPDQPEAAPAVASTVPSTIETKPEAVLLVAVGDHLDRTQVMLVELMNADTSDRVAVEADQSRARDLVAANRIYRQTAEQAGEQAIGDVLEEIERVLVEIANSPPEVSARELATLRARIEAKGLLFRVRVVQSEMRERERKSSNSGSTS